jgi:hypothetical protein
MVDEPRMPCAQCGGDHWTKNETPVYLVPALWDDRRKCWIGYTGAQEEGPSPKAVVAFECFKCRHVVLFAADEPREGD